MAEEHITAQPSPAQTNVTVRPVVEPEPGSDTSVDVPDITLPHAREKTNPRIVQIGLGLLLVATTCMSGGFGVEVDNQFIFLFIVTCYLGFAIALAVLVGISAFRAIESHRTTVAAGRHSNNLSSTVPNPMDDQIHTEGLGQS